LPWGERQMVTEQASDRNKARQGSVVPAALIEAFSCQC
jgi:hypothetical protein